MGTRRPSLKFMKPPLANRYRMPIRKAFWVYAAVFALLMTAFVISFGSINVMKFKGFVDRGVATTAVINDVHTDEHLRAYYTYVADGKSYPGSGRAAYVRREGLKAEKGARIRVYYDRAAPSRSIIGNPAVHLRNELLAVFTASVLFPLPILYFLWAMGVLPGLEKKPKPPQAAD
jgi:hypothetical protein